ncbi:MAG: hypothetical protein QXP49_05995 [Nitrososphaerota archaeon]
MAKRLGNLSLPQSLRWVDEFEWNKIEQKVEYSVNGDLIVQQGVKSSGRNITLSAPRGEHCWVTRSFVKSLYNLSQQTGTLELEWDSETISVVFDRKGAAFEVEPLWELVDEDDSALYVLKRINLIAV